MISRLYGWQLRKKAYFTPMQKYEFRHIQITFNLLIISIRKDEISQNDNFVTLKHREI